MTQQQNVVDKTTPSLANLGSQVQGERSSLESSEATKISQKL
jgi:hypothetical protein